MLPSSSYLAIIYIKLICAKEEYKESVNTQAAPFRNLICYLNEKKIIPLKSFYKKNLFSNIIL